MSNPTFAQTSVPHFSISRTLEHLCFHSQTGKWEAFARVTRQSRLLGYGPGKGRRLRAGECDGRGRPLCSGWWQAVALCQELVGLLLKSLFYLEQNFLSLATERYPPVNHLLVLLRNGCRIFWHVFWFQNNKGNKNNTVLLPCAYYFKGVRNPIYLTC